MLTTIKGDPTLAEQVLSNRAAQEQLAESAPDHPARAFGEAVEAGAPAEPWPSLGDVGAVAARVAEAVLPQLVEHLVPVCVSKFQGALEKIWARRCSHSSSELPRRGPSSTCIARPGVRFKGPAREPGS